LLAAFKAVEEKAKKSLSIPVFRGLTLLAHSDRLTSLNPNLSIPVFRGLTLLGKRAISTISGSSTFQSPFLGDLLC
jgi:hypothetical protein